MSDYDDDGLDDDESPPTRWQRIRWAFARARYLMWWHLWRRWRPRTLNAADLSSFDDMLKEHYRQEGIADIVSRPHPLLDRLEVKR